MTTIRIDDDYLDSFLHRHLDALPYNAEISITAGSLRSMLDDAKSEGLRQGRDDGRKGVLVRLGAVSPEFTDEQVAAMPLEDQMELASEHRLSMEQVDRLLFSLPYVTAEREDPNSEPAPTLPADADRLQRVIAAVAEFVNDENLTPGQQEHFAAYIGRALGGEIAGDSNGVAELTALVSADIAAEHGLGAA